jgi:carbon storage regulator
MEGPVAANDIMEGSIMLVLSRKVGESILISESIRVTVVQSAKNGRIRLGIDAPPEVIVLREELTKSCVNSSPSKNGKGEALPPSAQLP